jgi:hypothetical protein
LGIIFGSLSSGFGVPQALLSVLSGVLYTWWAWHWGGGLESRRSVSTEENKDLARRSWELANQHNPDLIEEF